MFLTNLTVVLRIVALFLELFQPDSDREGHLWETDTLRKL